MSDLQPLDSLIPLALFAFVSSITPGPNNIMVTSSGLLFGFARTVPHILGITFGFGTLLALCAAGIGALITAVPALQLLLRTAGSVYLLYLAWSLRTMAFNGQDTANARPMSFFGAALFQYANPKGWVMAVTGASAFLPPVEPAWLSIALFCGVFCLIGLSCIAVWAGTGATLRRYLNEAPWQRLFCVVMVLATIYSAVAIWL